MKQIICALIGAIALSVAGGTGPGKDHGQGVRYDGDPRPAMGRKVHEQECPGVTIQVTGGGSGTGISALINGTTDICNASRPMKPSERDKLKVRFGSLGVEIKAAKDGLSVYVHESNPVTELSLAQLKAIYTGEITNWKALGGRDERIIVYGRENNSGTYVYFKDNVLDGEDYAPTMQSMPGTAAVVNAVAKDRSGIGYGGAAYGKGIREIKVKKDEAVSGLRADGGEHQVRHLSDHPLPLYVRQEPSGGRHEGLHRLDPERRRAGGGERGGLFPDPLI